MKQCSSWLVNEDFRFPYRQSDTVDRGSCFPDLYKFTSEHHSTGEDVNYDSEHLVIISDFTVILYSEFEFELINYSFTS